MRRTRAHDDLIDTRVVVKAIDAPLITTFRGELLAIAREFATNGNVAIVQDDAGEVRAIPFAKMHKLEKEQGR